MNGVGAVATPFFAFLTAIGVAYIGYLMAKLNVKQTAAVKAAELVATTLVTSDAKTSAALATIEKTTEAVHTLVNSAMSKQLMVAAVALRRIAAITNDKADIEAAELAETAYHDHEFKQRSVDSKKN